MLQEMRKFNDNFAKRQAEIVVTKRVNSELCKRIVTVDVSAGQMPITQEKNV